MLDEPETVDQEDPLARSPTPGPRSSAAPDKAGISNLIEILAAVRGVDARRRSSASSTARGYGDFKQAVADAVVE